jgi:hypothetical protein
MKRQSMLGRLLPIFVVCLVAACGPKPTVFPGTDDVDAGPTDGGGHEGGVTWYRDVLPLVQDNCQGCHTEGGIAPFPFTTYQEAAPRHEAMAVMVSSRQMPPWMPDESCIDLKRSRTLTQEQIDVFVAWSQAGAPPGNPDDAPSGPAPLPGLPTVSATFDPGAEYQPKNIADDYRCFILPPSFTAQTDVRGYDVVPGTPTQVHHVILVAIPSARAPQLDDGEAGLGWTCYGGPGVPQNEFQTVKMLGGWVPGTGATVYPTDTGIRVSSGDAVVMQVHYNTRNGPPAPDLTQVKLMYATSPVAKPAQIFPVSTSNFSIPPKSTGTTATASWTFDLGTPLIPGATIYGVTPHMHELGQQIRVERVRGAGGPSESRQCLMDVPQWDFHWQQPYEYEAPVHVLRFDRVDVTCTWNNPGNATVTWGEGTQDEMCVTFFYVTVP